MAKNADARAGVGRRQFLHTAVSTAVVGIAARSSSGLRALRRLPVSVIPSPEAALQELLAGNQRFAANRLTSGEQDLSSLRAHTVEHQTPFAGVLGCADSRVPVELVFDQSIGQIFTVRVAGNIVTPEIIASLEYAVAVLSIRAVLVLGHTNCGAVKAAMKTESAPGQISALYPHLRPAVNQAAGSVGRAIDLNAHLQADLLRTSSTVIGEAITSGTLKVSAGVYDLATGRVTVS
ncbi:MAG TPA: carbonic anhydrase [Gemmatimonadaceae bacterium]|nr:carbonic anhydrase [Gemmatimonadaceae bacterium]